MKKKVFLVLTVLVLCLAGCAPGSQEGVTRVEADVQAINQAGEQFIAAFEANDAPGLAALYAADAVLMPPNEPATNGNEAIGNSMQSFLSQFNIEEFNTTADEVVVAGDWAFRRGTFSMAFSPVAGGDAIQDAGKFIEIWKRQADGSWKLARDIWNSNSPPAAGRQ